MDTILINLDFPEAIRDKFKQEKVSFVLSEWHNYCVLNFDGNSVFHQLMPLNTGFGVNCTTFNW